MNEEERQMRASVKIKRTKTEIVAFSCVFGLFVLYAILLLVPFVYGVNIALKENGRAFMRDPVGVTYPFYFVNFVKAFSELKINENTTFLSMTFNSLWYAAGSTLMSITACTCTAYVVAKYNFKGRGFIYGTALIVMMIPIYGALPAQYKLYTKLSLINSPFILITSFGGFGVYFIYIHAFFKSLSWSYAEAAFIDGASDFRVFITIMVPMMLPSISALAVMNFIGIWNDYSSPLLWLPDMLPLATGLYTFEYNMKFEANQPVFFAGVFLSIIPVLLLFVIFQNTIMASVYSGGLKG